MEIYLNIPAIASVFVGGKTRRGNLISLYKDDEHWGGVIQLSQGDIIYTQAKNILCDVKDSLIAQAEKTHANLR